MLKKAINWLVPGVETSEDGREKWPSRASFILAGMGSAVGLGNLLRYPSVVFANYGLQWFIPYLMALFFVGIPLLLVEIAMGQAYRGGAVTALGRVNPHLRGLGLAAVTLAFTIASYYNVILAWVMVYLRNSFVSPLPWKDRPLEFLVEDVIRNNRIEDEDTGVVEYPNPTIIGETFGWGVFAWILVIFSIFKGVSWTGRVVYVTMILPIIMLIVLVITALTLEGAGDGVALYVGTFRGETLGTPQIWQDAVGQIFFSIGAGAGIFFAYASYNSIHSNAVQDALIIACSNSLFEVVAGFAAFAMIGFLQLPLDTKLSTFTLAFITYPNALAQIPGSNVWAVFFFLMLMLLGVDSAFSLAESFITMLADSRIFRNVKRWIIVLGVSFVGILFGLMYSSTFGETALDAVDTYTNKLTLVFVPMCEAISINTLYRWRDVAGQVGQTSWYIFNGTYIGAMMIGLIIAHTADVGAGAGVFFGLWVIGFAVATVMAKEPTVDSPWVKGGSFLNKFWWLSSYSGYQLTKDLNVHVNASGKNWNIPIFWAPLLKWFTAPVLMIIVAFIFPDFAEKTNDPLHVFGFIVGLGISLFAVFGFLLPRILVPILPPGDEDKWKQQYAAAPGETLVKDKLPSTTQDVPEMK